MLNQLPYPVYFVYKNLAKIQNLINLKDPPDVKEIFQYFITGADAWCLQTYINLKRRGLNVHIVSKYIREQICVVDYDNLLIKDFPFNSYVVVCRHDRGKPKICEQCIVQNRLNVNSHTDHFQTHWPQVGLQPRNSERGTKIENIVYRGRDVYLAEPFKNAVFFNQLKSLDISLSISKFYENNPHLAWIDYQDADLVLAVRNCTEYDLSIKPANKLVNAWFAGCPAILGPEPAYQALKRSELDYIEVTSPEQAIAAIKRLKNNPNLYEKMIENGRERAKDFTPDAIASQWYNLLAGPITEGYESWLRQSFMDKLLRRPLKFGWRAFEHKKELKYFFIHINQGKRLFTENNT